MYAIVQANKDSMKFLPWIQITLSFLLVGLILIQQSEAGLGAWSGGNSAASSFHTKRGAEKVMFITTIIISIAFIVSSISALFI